MIMIHNFVLDRCTLIKICTTDVIDNCLLLKREFKHLFFKENTSCYPQESDYYVIILNQIEKEEVIFRIHIMKF